MNHLKVLCSLIVLTGLMVGLPGNALAEPAKEPLCGGIEDLDKLNLCRAFEIDKAKTEEQKRDRYRNKNHSTYYCSLIKDLELKKYCFAVATQTKSSCVNIVDASLEKKCNARIK